MFNTPLPFGAVLSIVYEVMKNFESYQKEDGGSWVKVILIKNKDKRATVMVKDEDEEEDIKPEKRDAKVARLWINFVRQPSLDLFRL